MGFVVEVLVVDTRMQIIPSTLHAPMKIQISVLNTVECVKV